MNVIARRIIVFLAPALFALVIGLGGARADDGDKMDAAYEVNVRGVTVLNISYSSEISAAGHRSQASLKTKGVMTVFSDYRMKLAATGGFADGQAVPQRYSSRSEKNDKEKTVELNWSKGVLSASGRPAAKTPEIQADIDTALTPAVTDPLTAIFRMGASPGGNPCREVHRIFDGKEVFELRFSFKRDAMIDDSFPGAYHGKAYECQASYVPIAGRYATKFRKNKEEPQIYVVWLAPVGADTAGGSRLIPVRATGRLDGLKFEAYANRLEVNGRPFKTSSSTAN